MWRPLALLGALVLLEVVTSTVVAEDSPARTKRLTTFGKTPATETDPKTPRGKECRVEEDCAALEFTTCKKDTDNKKRCLCYDLQPPANGECATKKRELHQPCNYDHECIHGAECVVNSTVKANEKRCYCRFGYEEEDNQCNSGHKTNAWISLMLFISLAIATLHTN
ncbi:uncharacterized protein LOC128988206 isoform X2 [Macrosteles quadrilineatus]|uniref:uncharacterized protein LOC128988206 isoform X2 n=1 Tax=Macrosteles quadrilineatus TaxID=74068 RepID=UPI0023E0D98C|nr:uncharacterized protein LOC128988206 isoform X2 [Macrosteles quadrilineatus]